MTLLWCDGFDHYGTDTANMTDGAWAEVRGTLTTANPRTGTHSIRFGSASSATGQLRRVFGGAKTTVGVGMAAWFSELPSSNDTMRIWGFNDNANVPQITIMLQSTGIIEVQSGSVGGAKLGDSVTPAITAEAYTHIECLVTIHPSAGQVEVRVNGVTVISLSGINTDPTGETEISQIVVYPKPNAFIPSDIYYDDIFCYDGDGSYNNTFIGDRRVLTLFPDADTLQADWSWSAGPTAYQAIDEPSPDEDVTYIFANPGSSPASVSEFSLDDLPAGVSAISALMTVNRMRKTDAGTANVQASIVSASSEAAGADSALTEAYTYYHDVVEVDPDTSAPFTPAAVDAVLLKIERTA